MGMMTRHNRMVRERERAKALSRPVPGREVAEEKVAEKEISFGDRVKALGLSRTEINRLNVAELQKIATDLGVEDASEMSGSSIKRMMIDALEE